MTEFKKASLENKLMDVVSMPELLKHPDLYDNNITAVECKRGSETFVLPYRPNTNIENSADKPGVYNNNGAFAFICFPDKDQNNDYQPEVTNLADVKNISEYISKFDKLRDMEKEILTSPDSITCPRVSEEDEPEMRALKQAINDKHIDLDKYSSRFGEDYPNKKRKLKDHKVTLNLLKNYCSNLDMKMTLIIEDKSADVANPIGHNITVDLTESKDDDDTNESEEV